MAAIFNRGGYDTMRTCKRGRSDEAANEQFSVRRDASKRGGTDETGSAWHGQQVLDRLAEREKKKDSDPFLIDFGFSHPHDEHERKKPLERNLAEDPRFGEKRRELEALLHAEMKRLDDPYRLWDQPKSR